MLGKYNNYKYIHLTMEFQKKRIRPGVVLTPIIPALWEAKAGRSLRSGVRDQSGQHDETLSLLKIQKLAGHGGARL